MFTKAVFIISVCLLLLGLAVASVPANECDNWQTLHPEWIFCDDFEDGTPLVRDGRYFEYDNDEGEFIVGDGIGVDGDYFGGSVCVSGYYAIVGAYYDDDNGNNSGSAYMFDRCPASDLAGGDCFVDFRDLSVMGDEWLTGDK